MVNRQLMMITATTSNHAMEPTPPDLIMSLFVVQPFACSLPRSWRRGSSCFR